VSREVLYYKGKYYQGSLTDDQADAIYSLVTEYTGVNSLRHCIKDTPMHVISDIKTDHEDYEEANGSLKGMLKDYSSSIRVGTLQEQQTLGVAFMYFSGSALLGDEVGMGKTVQIAGLVNVLREEYVKDGKDFHFCFLTEKSNIGQIRDKMIQFTGEFVGMLESGERQVVDKYLQRNSDKRYYSIVGGHSLLNSSEFLTHCAKKPFDLIVIDESSVIKNTSSDYYSNCEALFKYHKRKILLNATPLETHARDFYNQRALLDKKFLPTVQEFYRTYCKMGKGLYGYQVEGYKDNVHEFREAVSLRYLARNRQDLGASYENNTYKTILVPLSDVQKELMRKTTLHQMVNDFPSGVDRKVVFSIENTPKVGALLSLLSGIDVPRDKALIYCRFVDCQEKLKDVLTDSGYRCVILNGKSASKLRTNIIRDFNTGVYDILITNVQRGIDLNECNNCIMYTIDPNPQKMVQVEGRMTREFDIEYKSVYLLVSEGKEKRFVEENLKIRVEASNSFVGSGRSMVLEAIKSGQNREVYRQGDKNNV